MRWSCRRTDPRSGWRTRSPRSPPRTGYARQAGGGTPTAAWDALGVCAALHVDGDIETSCPDCGERIHIEVRDGRSDPHLLFHCLVPASHWWVDIGFT